MSLVLVMLCLLQDGLGSTQPGAQLLSPPQSLQDSQKRRQPSPQAPKVIQSPVSGTSHGSTAVSMAVTEEMTKEELEAVIREILADPTFPAFVAQVSDLLNSGDASTSFS